MAAHGRRLLQDAGVSRNASQADIQKAYRELARKYHPDMNPDDKSATKKFQQIQRAFDVLNNPEKREMYDRYGSSFETMGAGPAAAAGAGPARRRRVARRPRRLQRAKTSTSASSSASGSAASRWAAWAICSPIFAAAAAAAAGAAAAGADMAAELEIPFATSITGGEVQLSVQRGTGKTETLMVKIPAGHRGRQEDPRPRPGRAGRRPGHARRHPHHHSRRAHPFFSRRGNHLHVRVARDAGRGGLGGQGRSAHAHRHRGPDHSPRHLQRHEIPRQRARRGLPARPRPATCWPRRKSSCPKAWTRPIANRSSNSTNAIR